MYRVDSPDSVPAMPARKPAGAPGYFSQGNEGTGQLATVVDNDILNAMMMEIITVITNAGISLSKTDDTQLWQALMALIVPPRSWHDVSSARAPATTYTNTHAYEITVSLSIVGSGDATIPFHVNGVAVATYEIHNGGVMMVQVPAGATYGNVGAAGITTWFEYF